ncbi:MAG: arginine--tRNA ligase [Thermoplasmata archaeon]
MFELANVKKSIEKELERIIQNKFSINIKVTLETPPEGMGDFAFPMFDLLKLLKKSPIEVGKQIIDSLNLDSVKKIEISGAYLNFHVNFLPLSDSFIRELKEKGKESLNFPKKNKKVILEHTSANPTGPLHVGRGRNPIIGDTLRRLLKKYGYDVETHYYVNDAGKQSAILIYGVENLKIETNEKKEDHALVLFYQKANELLENDQEVSKKIEGIMMDIERGDEERIKRNREILLKVLNGIKETLKMINVEFDIFYWETDLIIQGQVKKVIDSLRCEMKEENGAYYIEIDKDGKNEKVFLIRNDGTSLYFTRDIAYHLLKSERGDLIINVLGEDHKPHAELLQNVLKKIKNGIEIKNVFYSFVSLPEGRMSTRKGRVVYLDDLLEEAREKAKEEILKRRNISDEKLNDLSEKIGFSAVRYNILKIQNEKQLVFKWNDALNFEGDSSPFLQYSYARANSILKKQPWSGSFSSEYIMEKAEISLIKQILLYPDVIENASENLKPYKIAKYAYDLASIFNIFYTECPVLKENYEIRENRLGLVFAFKTIMEDLLETMGIDHPEEI